MEKEFKSMTVKELIELLKQYPEDMKIGKEVPSGDHWGTRLAFSVDPREIGIEPIAWSNYHLQFKLPENPSGEPEEILVL